MVYVNDNYRPVKPNNSLNRELGRYCDIIKAVYVSDEIIDSVVAYVSHKFKSIKGAQTSEIKRKQLIELLEAGYDVQSRHSLVNSGYGSFAGQVEIVKIDSEKYIQVKLEPTIISLKRDYLGTVYGELIGRGDLAYLPTLPLV